MARTVPWTSETKHLKASLTMDSRGTGLVGFLGTKSLSSCCSEFVSGTHLSCSGHAHGSKNCSALFDVVNWACLACCFSACRRCLESSLCSIANPARLCRHLQKVWPVAASWFMTFLVIIILTRIKTTIVKRKIIAIIITTTTTTRTTRRTMNNVNPSKLLGARACCRGTAPSKHVNPSKLLGARACCRGTAPSKLTTWRGSGI